MLTSFKLRIAVSILIIFEIQIDTQIDTQIDEKKFNFR